MRIVTGNARELSAAQFEAAALLQTVPLKPRCLTGILLLQFDIVQGAVAPRTDGIDPIGRQAGKLLYLDVRPGARSHRSDVSGAGTVTRLAAHAEKASRRLRRSGAGCDRVAQDALARGAHLAP